MRRSITIFAVILATCSLFAAEPPAYQGRTAEQWSEDLANPSSMVRVAAAKALVALRADAHPAIAVLLVALNDTNGDVRLYSAYSLGQIAQRPAACLEALTRLLSDADEHVRYSAEWSLARIATNVAQANPTAIEIKRIDEILSAAEAALTEQAQRQEHLEQVKQARELLQKAIKQAASVQPVEEPKVAEKPAERTPEQVQVRTDPAQPPSVSAGLSSEDKLIQLQTVESLRRLERADLLIQAWESVDEGGFLYWHLSRALVRMGEAAVPELSQALRHEAEGVRYQAAQCLKEIGPAAADSLPQLVALIEDPSVSVDMRAAVILVLERLGPTADAAGTLTRLLEGQEDDSILSASAQALAAIGADAKAAVPSLLAVVQRGDLGDDTRIEAARAAARIAPESAAAVQTILPLLDEPDEFLVAGLAGAIGEFGPTAAEAVPKLLQLLESSSDDQRQTVVQALGKIGPPARAATSRLIARLADIDEFEWVQVAAARAIAEIGDDAVRSLAVQLDHPDLMVRRTAARAYVEMGEQATPAMADLLRKFRQPEEDENVRAMAAVALGQIGPAANSATVALAAAVAGDEMSDYLRAMSAIAIGQIDPDAIPMLITALDDPSPRLQVAAAYSLQRIPTPHSEGLPTLLRALDDDETRQLAVRALVDLGNVNLPQVAELVADPTKNVDVRLAGLQVLSEFGHDSAVELLKALNDQELVESAYWGLRDMGNHAIPHLLAAAEDDANLSEDARIAVRELVEEFHDGIGGDGGDTAWTGGHALMERSEARNGSGAAAALDVTPPGSAPGLRMPFSELEPLSPPEREPIEESAVEEAADMLPHESAGAFELDPATPTAPTISEPETRAAPPWTEPETRVELPLTEPETRVELPLIEPETRVEAGREETAPPLMPPSTTEPAARSLETNETGDGAARQSEAPAADTAPPSDGHKSVKVFYGTNRKPIDSGEAARPKLIQYLLLPAAAALVGLIIHFVRRRHRTIAKALTGAAGIALLCFVGIAVLDSPWLGPVQSEQETEYGPQYNDRVELGYCEVSIPEVHEEGRLEGPSVLLLQFKADPLKHIVLQRTQRLEREDFFADLDGELQRRGRSILVFVHGYNVSFENAARRTAQMSYDLKLAGAPMFYSWPSQADWRKYRLDEKNVELSIDPLKSFLTDVAHRSRAHTINLIAHSMGNRALTRALKEIEVSAAGEAKLFNQVILAAPDIDADIFKQRIAPAIVGKARHITLYASSNDLALAASQEFHSGDPRAGDAGQDLVLVPGIETIDVSAGDTSLLGHSYFGSSTSVLRDIELLLRDQPAAMRQFLRPEYRAGTTYWRFQPATASRRRLEVQRY